VDECLYILHKDGQVLLLVLVYVDDAALASHEITQINKSINSRRQSVSTSQSKTWVNYAIFWASK
jgi:hypothetical protein